MTRVLLLSCAVCLAASTAAAQAIVRSAAVDADWRAFTASWDGARVVDVMQMGARGDARVAVDCGMTAGSATLTCRADRFSAADTGKAIAVYEAGLRYDGGVQPLSTTIEAVLSPRSVTLAGTAATTVTQSSRVIWGTDDTAAIQSAIDALAAPMINDGPGGIVHIPAGHYLVRGVSLPCARTGTWGTPQCVATYNHIWIRGAGAARTTIENWDVDTPAQGVVVLGRDAEVPGTSGNDRLAEIAISSLSLRQVSHATAIRNVIWSYATEQVWIVDTRGGGYSYECYVMGGGAKSARWRVHYNELGPCGSPGPSYPNTTSALNLNGEDWVASHNLVTDSRQGVEMGSRRGTLVDNTLIAAQHHTIGVNVGSAGAGIWDNTIARNRIVGFITAIEVSNSLGTVNRTTIADNSIVNGGISVNSGRERNSVVEGASDGVVHGTSTVSRNTFTYPERFDNAAIRVGTGPYGPHAGVETVIINGNTITSATRVPAGFLALHTYGAPRWRPGAEYEQDAHVVPPEDNGSFYVAMNAGTAGAFAPAFPTAAGATITDGSLTWRNAGRQPMVIVTDNVLRAPAGATSGGRDIALYATRPESLRIERLDTNYRLETLQTP